MATKSSNTARKTTERSKSSSLAKFGEVDNLPFYYSCVKCGKRSYDPINVFYKSATNPIYSGQNNYAPICIECVLKLFEEYKFQYGDEKTAILLLCANLGLYFSEQIYIRMKEQSNEPIQFPEYLRRLNLAQVTLGNFNDYIVSVMHTHKMVSNVQEEQVVVEDKWTKEERENKRAVIDTVGYDPFESYPLADRKYLFSELVKYFDDDIAEDTYKLSQVIQIVNNNNQIRHYDMIIASLNPLSDAKQIGNMNNLKSSLVQANDKIAKENEISVKNRSNKEAGKSTLTYLQKYLRELDFKRAEADYYDQLKGEGTMWGIQMSTEAILKNTFFDADDLNDIKNIRREMVQSLQSQVDDLTEDKRKLYERIEKLEQQLEKNNILPDEEDDK